MKFMVALDGSDNANMAFEAACELLKPGDLLYLISVAEFAVYYNTYVSQTALQLNLQAEKRARRILIKYCQLCIQRGIKHFCILGQGETRDIICEQVEQRGIDTLVIGRKGLSTFERIIVGSVSEHCVKNAKCNVFVVKQDRVTASANEETGKKLPHGCKTAADLLNYSLVFNLVPNAPVVFVENHHNIKHAFDILASHSFHSVPVFDNAKEAFVGSIDMVDIMNYILQSCTDLDSNKVEKHLSDATCAELAVESCNRNPYFPIDSQVSLRIAMETLADKLLHRLAVTVNKPGKGSLIGILSQSNVLNYALSHLQFFPLAARTVSELHFGFRPVISVNGKQKVREAFQLIKDNKISGLAVVNDAGNLIGSISASDLRVMGFANILGVLNLPMTEFLPLIPDTKNIPGLICVQPTATIEELLLKFSSENVHRIFIVNVENQLVGVITQTDVVRLLLEAAKE